MLWRRKCIMPARYNAAFTAIHRTRSLATPLCPYFSHSYSIDLRIDGFTPNPPASGGGWPMCSSASRNHVSVNRGPHRACLLDYSTIVSSLSRWTRNLEETCSVTPSQYTRPFYILSSTHENCQTGRIFPSARNVVAEAIKTGHPGVIRLRHVRTIERASAVRNSAQETASSTIKLIRYVVVSTRPYTGRLATKPLKPARAVRPA